MSNVLLTCVGRRNYLAKYFRQALAGRGKVIGTDMDFTAPGLIDCDEQRVVPGVYAEDYIDQLVEICAERQISLLVSLNDLELPLLASARERFEQLGVRLAISDALAINTCFDKLLTCQWLQVNGFPTPATHADLDEAISAIHSGALKFPCIVKPRWGSGSIGIFTVYDLDELKVAHTLVKLQIARGMLSTVSQTDPAHSVLIQSRCTGVEYGCDILNDFSGVTRAVIVKEKLAMRAGETDKAVVRLNEKLADFCQSLGQGIGHVGNLDCDIFVDGDHFQVLEMNPRFGGGYPFSHVAGADYPEALLAWAKGEEYHPLTSSLTYNQPYSKFDTLGRVGDFSTVPSRGGAKDTQSGHAES